MGARKRVGADLSLSDGQHALAAQLRAALGERLDILVTTAGISRAATIEEMVIEDFDALFAVNVRARYFLVQQLLPGATAFTRMPLGPSGRRFHGERG